MQVYLELLEKILTQGKKKQDRTGVGTYSLFGETMRFSLQQGFPLVTTKKIYTQGVVAELLWFLRGDTNLRFLHQHACHIWDQWADANGELGPIYGFQWRKWNGKDQIAELIQNLKQRPDSRRHILNAWNLADLPEESITPQENVRQGKMALAPCHVLSQFYVHQAQLSCQVYLRSQDFFLGTPFNLASYALLTHILALECGYEVGDLVWVGGDVHLYSNHLEQAKLQLKRKPFPSPRLRIDTAKHPLESYAPADFIFENYLFHPKITAEIAV